MPVDAVFCDQSGKEFNEFIPVDLVLCPYVRDLQATADAHCSKAAGKVAVCNFSTQKADEDSRSLLLLGLPVSSNRSSLGDERASSGQSVTEPISAPQGEVPRALLSAYASATV